MDPSDVPTVETGMEVEESSFVWKVKNFPVIMMDDEVIKAQVIDFSIGGGQQASKWNVCLVPSKLNEKKWIGLYYTVKERPCSKIREFFYSRMHFGLRNEAGAVVWEKPTNLRNISSIGSGCGFPHVVDGGEDGNSFPETLEIYFKFQLYYPARQIGQASKPIQLQVLLEEFQVKSMARARKDLGGLVRDPIEGGDIKIMSSDWRQFSVPKGILCARSPVFDTMLRTDVTESKDGMIELPDITGKTLEVLLRFIYTGELLPSWKENGVLIELTNAAAKYQLRDLLGFLDSALGKVCHLGNVAPLLTLADQLSLKTAEGELMKFVREKGISSKKNFFKIMEVIASSGGGDNPAQSSMETVD